MNDANRQTPPPPPQPVHEQKPEVIDAGALEVITRSEIDMHVSTAKKYPRSLEMFKRRAIEMATFDKDTAEKCFYRLPRKQFNKETKQWETKWITGESIRLAEIALAAWTNVRVGARGLAIEHDAVNAQGICVDMENNVWISWEVRRGILTSTGQRYSADMINMTMAAAKAIAVREAVFKVVPKAMLKGVVNAARALVRGDAKSLPERVQNALAWLDEINVKHELMYNRLGIKGKADVNLDHLEILAGLKTAIEDKEIDLAEAFPPIGSEESAGKGPEVTFGKPKVETPAPGAFASAPAGTGEAAKPDPKGKGKVKVEKKGGKKEAEKQAPAPATEKPKPALADQLKAAISVAHVDDLFTVKSAVGSEGATEAAFLKLKAEDQQSAFDMLMELAKKRAAGK